MNNNFPHRRPPPFAPNGFMTIPVEVPPNLSPMRRMLIYVTPTYPVEIQVPPEYPPRTIIPVLVPIPPDGWIPPNAHVSNHMPQPPMPRPPPPPPPPPPT
ncbi:unnamed protein product [Cylindrotheca closterium]|uniref:Uncharacterized protein n=1 Tax=Cylindrotheca closterium TaxID=2856 RepID=A0AAD2GDQ6_9STRA|nr:unnamed protein product [Cylindrotheca closterium]